MKDISIFNNVNTYLPLLNSVLITDVLYMFLLYYTNLINSKILERWYETYRLSGVLADVTIIMLGFIITRYLYYKIFNKFSLLKFVLLLLLVQITHDILFALLFYSIPKGVNKMIDLFKDYGNELGFKAILGDSSMMIVSLIILLLIKDFTLNSNIIILIITLYFLPYILYTK